MNILITCAGRRTYTVKIFKEALLGRGQTFACDSSAGAPALQEADRAFLVPQTDADGYIETLLSLCREYKIKVLIPALEPELPLLARHRARFLEIGTFPLVSSLKVIDTCYDKLRTANFLDRAGLAVPKTFLSVREATQAIQRGEVQWPLIIKPRWGVSSICLGYAHDTTELELLYRLTQRQLARTVIADVSRSDPQRSILIQEHLKGSEYGLDVINDLNGRYVCTLVKKKLRMWAGQTDRAVTVRNSALEHLGRVIGESLGHYGLLDCDAFVTAEGCCAIDINPRIGGGYPFSHVAGANFPAALVAWVSGERLNREWLNIRENVTASRSDMFLPTPLSVPLALTLAEPMPAILSANLPASC